MTFLDIPAEPNLERMRRDRGTRLRSAMADNGVDAMLLLATSNVIYGGGISWPLADAGRAHIERPVVLLTAGDNWPHLFTPFPDGFFGHLELPEDHLHGPAYLDFDEGVDEFAAVMAGLVPLGGTVAVDECTGSMMRNKFLLTDVHLADAGPALGAASVIKTRDEIACIRRAQHINEQAMVDVQAALVSGVRQTDMTARFLRRVFELGAEASVMDPIWHVIPSQRANGPWTTHGELAFPSALSTERELAEGDVIWVDTAVSYAGYHSDFGRTWVVGRKPSSRQQAQFKAWREIMAAVLAVTRAGATSADLTQAAIEAHGGTRPWLAHLYLGHSVGSGGAGMPLVGTYLGEERDAGFVLAPGMVLVLEPVIWEDGFGGYRSEEVGYITEEGFTALSDYPYDPYVD